jgi:prohibitin 1
LLFRPDPEKLPEIHNKYGPEYDEGVLPGLGNEVLKAVVVGYIFYISLSFW